MAKVLVTEGSLSAIGAAIRNKLGVSTTYKPGEMAAAIGQIHGEPALQQKTVTVNGDVTPDNGYDGLSKVTVDVPPPTLVSKSIAVNGAYPAANENADGFSSVSVNVPNTYAAADEGKVVQNGALAAQTSRAVTANGTYDTTVNNRVVVNVAGGGSGSAYPFMDEIIAGGTGFAANVAGSIALDVNSLPANVRTFYNDYARTPKPTTANYNIGITVDDIGLTLAGLMAAHEPQVEMEYYGCVYENTSMIEDLGLALLGDFSQGGAAAGNALLDSIANYSAVILQGVYQKNRTRNYNTSMLYLAPALNQAYWAGMKDRNASYDCFVTFTDNTTVSLSGNKQVIIYGVP